MRPFGCPVIILNTIDHLGKFDGKADEGFFVGYSLNSKAFRVNDLMVFAGQNNPFHMIDKDFPTHDDGSKPSSDGGKKVDEDPRKESECNDQEKEDNVNSTNNVNATSINKVNVVDDEDDGAEADMNNLDTTIQFSPILTTRIHKDRPPIVSSSKWVFRNKKNERGIVIRNKAKLVAQGYTQEEGIDYDEVFAPVARIEAIRLFLAYASFKDFVVYQMDVKSSFLYRKIEEEVYVCQPPGFEDPDFPNRVYKVEKALYGLHQAPRAWFTKVKTASTPMETQKPLLKDEDGEEVDVHMYRSMIGSLMYLTSSRPDNLFAVCACARYQVNPKVVVPGAKKPWDTIAQTRFENVSKLSNDSMLGKRKFGEGCIQTGGDQGRKINVINADEDITLINVQDDVDNEMFDVNILNSKEVFVAGKNENVVEEVVDAVQVSTAATVVTITTEEITLAQALEALKTSKPKVKGIVFQEPSTTTTTTTISSQQSQDNEWDDIQAKIDVDYQLAERLQAQEQEELSDAEKATLFQQLQEKKRKHFTAKRAEEQRNKPPT
ncbi:retrovirus-related pol polyprotein from transposon TNT 1-94 [Tanacetum coccineum]